VPAEWIATCGSEKDIIAYLSILTLKLGIRNKLKRKEKLVFI